MFSLRKGTTITPGLIETITALLGGRPVGWPNCADDRAESEFLSLCRQQGVAALVEEKIRERADWPAGLREALRRQSVEVALRQTLDDRETTTLLSRLASHGLPSLLLKGAAFAHLLYRQPSLRRRDDTDLLIRPQDLDLVREALLQLGYIELAAHTGELIMFQKSFRKELAKGHGHIFDVHWKISNAHVFRDRMPFDELLGRSIAVPALGPHARALSPADSLLHACIHRVGHHANSLRTIWLHDILLLAEQVKAEGTDLARLANEKGLAGVTLDGLRAAQAVFRSAELDRLVESLSKAVGKGGPQAGADLLLGKGRRRTLLWSDFRSQPGPRRKLQWVRENLLPPRDHLVRPGQSASWFKLGRLYLKRALRGCWRILRER